MKIIDLTQLITASMPVYPGTEPPHLTVASTYETDGFRETLLSFFSHTGTHMDAPFHLFGDRTCIQYGAGEEIGMEALAPVRQLADEADFLLFHTGWSRYWGKAEYFGDYPVPSQEVCRYALESGKKGLGFDTIGIDPIADEGLTRHRLLLSQRDIVIIENLTNLDKIGEGLFLFAALPLKYENADGAPVRAIAMPEEE